MSRSVVIGNNAKLEIRIPANETCSYPKLIGAISIPAQDTFVREFTTTLDVVHVEGIPPWISCLVEVLVSCPNDQRLLRDRFIIESDSEYGAVRGRQVNHIGWPSNRSRFVAISRGSGGALC